MYYHIMVDEGKRKKYSHAFGVIPWPEELVSCKECNRQWNKSLMHTYGINLQVILTNDYYPDFVWYYINLISEKAKNVLENEHITGYVLEKTDVLSLNSLSDIQMKNLRRDGINLKKIPIDPPPFYKLHVKEGAKFHASTNIIRSEYCNSCGYEKYHTLGKEYVDSENPIILDKSTISDYDIFTASGYGYSIFCSERFKELYIEDDLKGLLFNDILEF